MKFPAAPYDDAGRFCDDYLLELAKAAGTVERDAIRRAAALMAKTISADAIIYSCGNGGSAAIAEHLVCDCAKGVQTDTDWRPRVMSLTSTGPLLSAIGNDISYAEVFDYQVRTFGRSNDLLFTISSSGDSDNIVKAIEAARQQGMSVISLTGFSGGRSRQLADVNLHVDAHNYGVVEDIHQSLMHLIMQYLRQSRMNPDLVGQRKF